MTTKVETEQCPRCKGSGALRDLPCPYCDRKGVVPKGEAEGIRRRMMYGTPAHSRVIDMYARRS